MGKGWDEWSKGGGGGGGDWGWSPEFGGWDEWGKGGGGDWGKGGGEWGKGGSDWGKGGGDWGKGGGDWGKGGWKGDGKGKGKSSNERGKGKGSTKGGQRVAAGETAYFGVVRSWNAEKRMAYIACDQLYWETGQDVYGHHTVIQSAGIGPGDTVIFFVHWSARGQPQASDPILRVKAGDGGYALKGVYKSGNDMEKGFGFIGSPELKDIYGRDVYVPKEIAHMLVSGQTVCYNVKINKEGMPNAEAAVGCDESWQPIPPDLSYTREVDVMTGLDKGKGKGHSHGQKDENRLAPTGRYFTGYLKSFKEASGWGFISADEVRAQYGTDAFVLNSQLRNTRKYIGEWVQFEVGINDRGQPQAMNVHSMEGMEGMEGANAQAPDAKRLRLEGPMTAVDGVGPELASTAAVAPGIGDTPAGGGFDGAMS